MSRRYWHIAHPAWTPGQPLRCRDHLTTAGINIPWRWEEADDGTDTDRVCLFPDTEQGRREARWLADDRPDYHVLRVDLGDDIEVTRALWEPYPAVLGSIPADAITLVDVRVRRR